MERKCSYDMVHQDVLSEVSVSPARNLDRLQSRPITEMTFLTLVMCTPAAPLFNRRSAKAALEPSQ